MKTSRLFLSLLFVFALISVVHSQNKIYKFAATGSDATPSIILTDTAGFIYSVGSIGDSIFSYQGKTVLGSENGMSSNHFLLKTNPLGKAIWLKTIRVVGGYETYQPIIAINNSGEMAIALSVNAEMNKRHIIFGRHKIEVESGNTACLIAKISKTGFILWVKSIEINSSNYEVIKDIQLDEDGNVFIAGDFTGDTAIVGNIIIEGFGSYNTKMFVAKYSKTGYVKWASTCDVNNHDNGSISAKNIALKSDGGIILSGSYSDGTEFIFGSDTLTYGSERNAYLAGFNSKGSAEWGISFSGDGDYSPGRVIIDANNNITFLGYYYKYEGEKTALPLKAALAEPFDTYIVQYNSSLTQKWRREFLLETTDNISIFGVDRNSNVYFADEFYSEEIMGVTNKGFSDGTSDIFACRLDGETSNTVWSFSAGSVDYEYINFGEIDKNGNLCLGAYFSNSFTFGSTSLNSLNSNSYFARIKRNGEVDFAKTIPNPIDATISLSDISQDVYGNVNIVGTFSGVGANLGPFPLGDIDNSGMFIAKYSSVASISGKIIDLEGTPIKSGWVKLYGCTYHRRSPISDSVEIQASGNYIFHDIPLGNYIVKALPDNSVTKEYLPAYAPSAGIWVDAHSLNVINAQEYKFFNVIVPYFNSPTGENRLSGLVNEIDTNDVFKSAMQKPIKGGKASLAKSKIKSSDYDIVAVTDADLYGFFEFDNVNDGTYSIFIDIPGLPQESSHTVVVEGGQYISNLHYFVSEESVTAVGEGQTSINKHKSDVESNVKLYPNPSADLIFIETSNGESINEIVIQNIQGKTLRKINNISGKIAITDLSAGIYFASVITENKHETVKFIITP